MTTTALMAVFQAFAALIGVCLGSFLNVAIERWPDGRSVVAPRSHCTSCGTPIRGLDLVPVLSWVLLRGRCRQCGSTISPAYPLIEVLAGLLAWLLFRRLVPSPDELDAPHALAWVVFFGFLCALVVATYVDVRHWIIPDEVSIYAAPAGFVAMLVLGWVGYDGWLQLGWRQSITGALMGGSALATASLVARWFMGREALGWGDVKLITMVGAFVGPAPVIFLVLLPASILGSIASLLHLAVTRRRGYLPYGPSLAAAAALYVFYGDIIAMRYLPGVALFMGLIQP